MTIGALNSLKTHAQAATSEVYSIRIVGTDYVFCCAAGTTVLDAALEAGWQIPYSCRRGVCETCECNVEKGTWVEAGAPSRSGPAQHVLMCRAVPLSDITIRPRGFCKVEPAQRRVIEAKIYRITRPADDVAIIDLRLPAGVRAKFLAGQYLDVVLDEDTRRSFSMASPPRSSGMLQLHVRLLPQGRFASLLQQGLGAGDVLRVELPLGDFYLRPGTKPVIFVAGGTGFAPVKSIIEDVIGLGIKREMVLYWGGRRPKDLYAHELARDWANKHPHIRFVPVVSDAQADDAWTGRTGLVHAAAMADFPDLSSYEVYACGAPAMVEACRREFRSSCRLPDESFYADSFVSY